MQISVDTHLPFPRSLVYTTYRDKLIDLVPYMPNVRQIQLTSTREEEGLLYLVHQWRGGGKIPPAARAFLSEDLLSWTNDSIWNNSEFTTQWQIKTHAFTEAVHCAGKNRFIEDSNGTKIESRGKLIIDPNGLSGVPKFFAGSVASTIENLLSQQIEPNFLQMSEGVQKYLQQSNSSNNLT